MANIIVGKFNLMSENKQKKEVSAKSSCLYGQRKAYMSIRRFQVVRGGVLKTRYYRKLSFNFE